MINITFIGCGNVASHLISEISAHKEHFSVIGCCGRKETAPQYIKCPYYSDFKNLPESDIYIVSVSDDAIQDVTERLSYYLPESAIVAHTSGTKPIDAISNKIKNRAVIYPLQTFNAEIDLNMKEVPFFIEYSNEKSGKIIELLAVTIGENATHANSDERRRIHIAAVFACNFTNHLFSIAQKILKAGGLEFSILEPLIKECVRKALQSDDISKLQTGPAIREDYTTIKSHTDMLLEYDTEIKKIYEDITNSIINNNGKF